MIPTYAIFESIAVFVVLNKETFFYILEVIQYFFGGFMTIPEMISQSGMLTVLGMGVVFSFLVILIAFMKLIEIFVKVTGIDKDAKTASSAATVAASPGLDQAVIAAIAAAINEKQKN